MLGRCINTTFKIIKNKKEKSCTGLLNKYFLPPTENVKLQQECKKRLPTTDLNKVTVLVSEACPTFCNHDLCFPIDKQTVLQVNGKGKRCTGLLNGLLGPDNVDALTE